MFAFGADSAAAFARSRTIDALVLKRSSRVIPGLRGTPAGIKTISASLRAAARPDGVGSYPVTLDLVLMWEISAATPIYPIEVPVSISIGSIPFDLVSPHGYPSRK